MGAEEKRPRREQNRQNRLEENVRSRKKKLQGEPAREVGQGSDARPERVGNHWLPRCEERHAAVPQGQGDFQRVSRRAMSGIRSLRTWSCTVQHQVSRGG